MGPLMISFYVLILAAFLGYELITKVPPTLHTPLMSGANAISGITLVGALVAANSAEPRLSTWLGTAAVALATLNVVGGFLVTDRMLGMFGDNAAKRRRREVADAASQPEESR